MKSAQYFVTNSPAIFFLWAMALVVWDIRRQIKKESKS